MGLIELCLLSLLSPQEPVPAQTPPSAQPPEATWEAPAAPETGVAGDAAAGATADDDRARLLAAERAGDDADGNVLLALTQSDDAAIAARAAWLLGRSGNPAHLELLDDVVTQSHHADARLQALQSLRQRGDVATMPLAVQSLGDEDRRVRTVAVQLLGKLRRPAAVEPLVALIDTAAKGSEPGAATDVQAALVTLADLGASKHLLRVATSIADGDVAETGTALTYCFQTLSPQLPPADETTTLVAVLSHREPMLRRYAITRLAELGSASAGAALEGRLAAETAELRPLVEVALAQIRRDRTAPPQDELERAKQNALLLWSRAKTEWHALPPLHQGLAASGTVFLLIVVWFWRRAALRRRQAAAAAETLAMVQPSEDYVADSQWQEGDDDGVPYEEQDWLAGDDAQAGEFDDEWQEGGDPAPVGGHGAHGDGRRR